jgi:hypothetical protein
MTISNCSGHAKDEIRSKYKCFIEFPPNNTHHPDYKFIGLLKKSDLSKNITMLSTTTIDTETIIQDTTSRAILSGTPYVITKQFPWKLHEMLDLVEQRGEEEIVSWLPGDHAFRVHKVDIFVKNIMKTSFNQTKYKSFQRQLNLWGFKRNTKECLEKGAYYHPLFIRGRRDLCKELERKRTRGEKTTTSNGPSDAVKHTLAPLPKAELEPRPDGSPSHETRLFQQQFQQQFQQANSANSLMNTTDILNQLRQEPAPTLPSANLLLERALNAYKERATMEKLLLVQAIQEQERSSKSIIIAAALISKANGHR